MSSVFLWLMGGILGISLLASPAHAAIKLIVQVYPPYFALADASHTPDTSGTQVCVSLGLKPWTQDERRVTECGARTALVASTACAAIKTLVIARAATEYSVTLVQDEVLVHGCPQ
jgi:hypothetical protein